MNLDIKNLRNLKTLPLELNSILIGIMLGDGGIYRSTKSITSNSRFEMSFGQDSEIFANWIAGLFSNYMTTPLKSIEIKGTNKTYINYRLKTLTLPVFNQYRDMFYVFNPLTNKYEKIVPKDINKLLDPIVLAYLLMGDGNFDKGRNRVRIYTNSFNKTDVENLALAINNKLGVYTGVLQDNKNQWILLTIGAKYLDLLRKTVTPYFHPSMKYRIGITDLTPSLNVFSFCFDNILGKSPVLI
jgi:LAGLIDADG DNA endonuclease family